MTARKEKEKTTFEDALKRLEDIVAKLESGNLPLEESLKLFQEGVGLVRTTTRQLEEVKQKVELLIKDQAGDVTGSQPFASEEEKER